jgi:hypothetical protein
MMGSGFAAGLLRVADPYWPGKHTALISKATWERFQAARVARRHNYFPNRLVRAPMALDGLVHCASCGVMLRLKDEPSIKHGNSGYMYQCEMRFCENNAFVTRHRLEQEVRAWSDKTAAPADEHVDTEISTSTGDVESLDAKLAGIAAGLVKNRIEYAMGEYGTVMRDLVDTALLQQQAKLSDQISQLAAAPWACMSNTAALEVASNWEHLAERSAQPTASDPHRQDHRATTTWLPKARRRHRAAGPIRYLDAADRCPQLIAAGHVRRPRRRCHIPGVKVENLPRDAPLHPADPHLEPHRHADLEDHTGDRNRRV